MEDNNQNGNNSTQSEYMSLEKLPLLHICSTCNLGFPDMPSFEEHCRTQGHALPTSSTSCNSNGNSAPVYSQLQTPAQQQQVL